MTGFLRTTELVAVLFAAVACAAGSGCTPSGKPATASSAGAPAEGSPESVARAFVEASNAEDRERFLGLLTAGARRALESDDGFGFTGSRFERYEIDAAQVTGDAAEVPVRVLEEGSEENVGLTLQREEGAWRVRGVKMSHPGGEMAIDFEAFAAFAESIAEDLGESLRGSFEAAAAADAARERELFEAIRPLSPDDLQRRWRTGEELRGQPALRALEQLAAGLGLTVDPGEHRAALAGATVKSTVEGLSRLEAIEQVCRDAGFHALPPKPLATDPGAPTPPLTIARGARRFPISFAGPFVFGADGVEENVPHGTGGLTFAARAYGVDPGALALTTGLIETVTFDAVEGPSGQSLRKHDDVRYMGGGFIQNGIYENVTQIELKHLLRSVTAIRRVAGKQRLAIPRRVELLEFSPPRKGDTRAAGDFQLTVTDTGEQTVLEVRGPQDRLDNLIARFHARDAAGADIQIFSEGLNPWGRGKAQAAVQTKTAPAELRLKLVTERDIIEFPFEVREIPLAHWEEMPAALETLRFGSHDAPVSCEFLALERSDEQFANVRLRAVNHSNKNALNASVQFYYLDLDGDVLKDFPHSLSGTFGPEGHEPLVAAGASAEVESTAFFVPDAARRVRVQVDRVEFVDGTLWESPHR